MGIRKDISAERERREKEMGMSKDEMEPMKQDFGISLIVTIVIFAYQEYQSRKQHKELERKLAEIKEMLAARLGTVSVYAGPPLHTASLKGDVKEVRRLLDAGEDPEQMDKFGHTPIDLVQMALAELEAGSIDEYIKDPKRAVQMAQRYGRIEEMLRDAVSEQPITQHSFAEGYA